MSAAAIDPAKLRVGTAVDVHAFADAPRPLFLACLAWPDEPGLAGHSDADVAAHAVCDAILIATGIGEMGSIFGTDRPEWQGASGTALIAEAVRLAQAAGWQILSVSVQIVGQRPRFSPRKAEAEAAMTAAVGAPVSVSATTTDHLGFTGREEGLAAIATALVAKQAS
ncbi:MAG: 2-C-methyl-D-erythritol 2,4-cyclodiphosphate synthase [Trueperella sp.]|nr:2-C-methyl-D-erythritol 2,4-cyclodiphosphate synthase [Trueperella sp.]